MPIVAPVAFSGARRYGTMIRRLAILTALVLVGCTGQPPASTVQATLDTPAASAREPSAVASTIAPSAHPSPSLTTTPPAAVGGTIVFSRGNSKTDDSVCFRIDPDGKNEAKINPGACGPPSPDGRKILTAVFKANSFGPLVDGRPAVANADGSGFKLLDAYPDSKISLWCGSWSPDGGRFLCESGQDEIATDDGIYTLRSTDGGDIRRLTKAPTKHEDQPHGYSPDGSHILFLRGSDEEGNAFFVMKADGSDLVRLSNQALSGSDSGLPADWSPDGSRVVFGAVVKSVGFTALFVVDADGRNLKQITTTSLGGVTAQWSPDGQWIAFTSRVCCQPQVWRVHPDGTGLQQLTDGGDGSISMSPIWSPNGSRLVFQQQKADAWTLWTMNPDGSGRMQIGVPGEGYDSIGPAAWGVSPAK